MQRFALLVLVLACSSSTNENPTLAADVQPILDRNCAVPACHAGAVLQAGMSLMSGDSFASLVDTASTQVDGAVRVIPGDPDNSLLVTVLRGPIANEDPSEPPLVERMPRDTRPLSEDEIALIVEWIAAGAER